MRTATLNPAEFFNMQDSLSTVEEGKIANLVLLDVNPMDNIENIQKVNSVVTNGKLLTRNALDRLLSEVKDLAIKIDK